MADTLQFPDMAAIARQTAQQQAAVSTLRLNIAGNVLAELAAVDFTRALATKKEKDAALPSNAPEADLVLQTGNTATIALAYTDHMLRMAGVIQ